MACFFFEQRHGQQFPIYRAVAGEGLGHRCGGPDRTVPTAPGSRRPARSLPPAPRRSCPARTRSDSRPGTPSRMSRRMNALAAELPARAMLQHGGINARALSQQQRLRGGDRLAEPQEVDQQFGGVPGAVPAGVHDPPRVRRGTSSRGAVPFPPRPPHRRRTAAAFPHARPLSRRRQAPRGPPHRASMGLLADGPGRGRGVAGHVDPGRSGRQFFEAPRPHPASLQAPRGGLAAW